MAAIFLVIKGNRAIAERETSRRGIAYTFDAESDNHNETYGYAETIDRPKIIDWYCEDNGWAGILNDGSCLWYADREAK